MSKLGMNPIYVISDCWIVGLLGCAVQSMILHYFLDLCTGLPSHTIHFFSFALLNLSLASAGAGAGQQLEGSYYQLQILQTKITWYQLYYCVKGDLLLCW